VALREPPQPVYFGPVPGNPIERIASRAVARPLVWALVIGAIAAWPLVWSVRTRLPPPPPIFGTVPAFELVDDGGRAFGSTNLAGRVWIASFVDTRCESACPATTRQLIRIQSRVRQLEPALHLVSFGADPAHDTPERLSAYARAHRASPRMWTFVTGPEAELRAVAKEALPPAAFHAASGDAIPHGTELVLVDRAARVRGRYDPDQPDVVDRVVRDAALLVNGRGE
jgi:protein SCO1/2